MSVCNNVEYRSLSFQESYLSTSLVQTRTSFAFISLQRIATSFPGSPAFLSRIFLETLAKPAEPSLIPSFSQRSQRTPVRSCFFLQRASGVTPAPFASPNGKPDAAATDQSRTDRGRSINQAPAVRRKHNDDEDTPRLISGPAAPAAPRP